MPDAAREGNTERIEAALRHVSQGFGAFSVWSTLSDGTCKCVKGPACTSPGKHPIPRDGFLAASTDPETVRIMLGAGSNPNYGICWPDGSDVVVILDVDGDDWKERIAVLKAEYGPLPPTKTTKTPSGGLHLFYRWPVGVPIPDTNTLHGFVARFPMKGYVVGPGSAINGKVYAEAGTEEMALLPVAWASPSPRAKEPLITVTDAPAAYEMPVRVETGHRHDEIVRLVASMWNRREDVSVIFAAVQALALRFAEPMDATRLQVEIADALSTAEKKWQVPAGSTTREGSTSTGTVSATTGHQATGRELIEVGLLDAPVSEPPIAMRAEAFTTSGLLAGLMDHWKPRTDASYESLLVQTLVYAGSLMGHLPCAFYGSRPQHTNVFATLVGTTGVSRKGTSADLVRGVWGQVSDAARGLSHSANSGEGVIALAAKTDGEPILIYEEEFARFLIAKGREAATLSPIMRQAFDDVPLSSVTATRNVRAESHHISMIAHVTREEVTDTFGGTDLKNGFANRIAWIGTFQRPDAVVTVHDNVLPNSLRDEMRAMLAWAAKMPRPLIGGTTHQYDPVARQMLTDASGRYNAGVGLAPFLSRRLDTIAARISLIYACLDQSRIIEPLHVEAALAVTDYAYATAKWVFPETTGDIDADLVLRHGLVHPDRFLDTAELEGIVGKKTRDKQRVADLLGLMGYARIAERPRRDGRPGRPRRGLEFP